MSMSTDVLWTESRDRAIAALDSRVQEIVATQPDGAKEYIRKSLTKTGSDVVDAAMALGKARPIGILSVTMGQVHPAVRVQIPLDGKRYSFTSVPGQEFEGAVRILRMKREGTVDMGHIGPIVQMMEPFFEAYLAPFQSRAKTAVAEALRDPAELGPAELKAARDRKEVLLKAENEVQRAMRTWSSHLTEESVLRLWREVQVSEVMSS